MDATNSDSIICPTCGRVVLGLMADDVVRKCGGDPLLDVILALAMTPPDHAAVAIRMLCPALEELDAYVAQLGAPHE